jgi:hypothetical protein
MTTVCRTTKGGDKFWYTHDKRHRDDGPAIEWSNGNKEWYQNDVLHREDGPAIEWVDGDTFWYINGIRLTTAEFAAKVLDEETALLWKMSGYCQSFDFGRPAIELNK